MTVVTLTSSYRPTTTLVFNEGDAGLEASVDVAIRQVTNPAKISLIQQAAGLTNAAAILEARLVTPRRVPSTVQPGSLARLSWAGVNGRARVEPYASSLPSEWRDEYGDRILLTFTSDEIP